MSERTPSSRNDPTSTTEETKKKKLEQLRGALADKGVDPLTLAVLYLGSGREQVIGNLPGLSTTTILVGKTLGVHNPKRFMRLEFAQAGGMAVDFVIGDWDLIQEGVIDVQCSLGYGLCWLDAESQVHYLELYVDYLKRKATNKAVASGLLVPETRIHKPVLR